MIRAVIFDFNGVLVDDESVHFELFRDVLAEEGVKLTEAMYEAKYLGYDDRRCFQEVLQDHHLERTPGEIDGMVARKADLYIPRADQGLRYFEGAGNAVRALSERWPVAINSGALRQEILYSLKRLGLTERISAIIAAEDTANCKPDPEGYLLALDALRSQVGEDLEAAHCLVFEDSLAGVQSAKGAGMWTVGVSNTYGDEALRGAGADAVVPGLESLTPAWVESLFAPEVSP